MAENSSWPPFCCRLWLSGPKEWGGLVAFLSMESGESVDLVHIASMPKNSEMRFELPPLYRESELLAPCVSFYQTSFEEQWPGSLHRLVEYSNDRSAVCPQWCIAGNSDLNRTCSPVKQVVSQEEWSMIQEINPLFVSVCWQQRYVCPFCETQALQHLKTCFCQWNEMNYTIYINIYQYIISSYHIWNSPQTDRPWRYIFRDFLMGFVTARTLPPPLQDLRLAG